ncbi:hypothetical protein H2248_004099 [Termitomyces sp. 'cryptogamus']|nr:hypothetical protein H2248_004099 [Termitomyces sp. 'cryptogamus']
MINNERVHHSHLALTSTGASSGFGLRLARSALKRGDRVIATAKSLDKLQNLLVANIDPVLRNNLHTLQLDVTEGETTLKAKASEAAAIWGQIDVLVNNADELRPLRIQVIDILTHLIRYRTTSPFRGRRVSLLHGGSQPFLDFTIHKYRASSETICYQCVRGIRHDHRSTPSSAFQ